MSDCGACSRPSPTACRSSRETADSWIVLRKAIVHPTARAERGSTLDSKRQGTSPPLPRARRPGRARGADRALHVAGALARPPLRVARRAARRSGPDRRDRSDQGDRPLRPQPRRRADHLRDAEHHRRDQAPLPRPRLGGTRSARSAGAEHPADARRRAADGRARPLADDRRAGRGNRGERGRGARGARDQPRLQPALALGRLELRATTSSIRSSRSAARSTSTRSRKTEPCSSRACASSTSASG